MNNDITTGKQIPLWQYTNGGNPAGVNITPVVIVGLSSLGTNDRKVRVLDKNGNVVATSTFEIPKTGTTMKEIHVVFDACLTTSTVWVKLYNGATEDVAVDTGLSFSSFFKTSNVDEWISGGKTPSGGAGAKLWGDNVGFRYTKTAADAVHLTGYPRPRVIGGVTAIPMAGQGRTPSTSADHLWGLTTGTSISGSDGGTPIKITTTAAHGLSNGAHVSIRGHTIDTAANGNWLISNVTSTTFTLDGSVGNGVGGATGLAWTGWPSELNNEISVAISSSTNATPIEITTATNHNLATGSPVQIRDHLINTAANGSWIITKVSNTKFTLDGSVGNGVGGATGTAGGQDADNTFIGSTAASEIDLMTYTAANPLPGGATVIKLQAAFVVRLTGAGKIGPIYVCRLGGTDDSSGVWPLPISTSYVGCGNANLSRPGGGSWSNSDFDLDTGQSKIEFSPKSDSGSPGSRVTLVNLLPVYSAGNLDAGTIPVSPRQGQISWAELEVPNAPRQGQISWAELEVPNAPRQGQISWAELEVPDAPRQGQISWVELEVPDAANREANISWVELEVPDAPRQGQVSWVELEVPDTSRQGQISWAELEVPNAPRQGQISWIELEIPDGQQGQINRDERQLVRGRILSLIHFYLLKIRPKPKEIIGK